MIHPGEQPVEQGQALRRRSAIAILVAFGMWAMGVLVLFPPQGDAIPAAALKSQTEARNTLRALAEKQLEHFRKKGRFEYDFNAIGFRPDPPVRYVIAFPASCTARHSGPTSITSSLEILSRGVASSDLRPRTLTVAERERISAHLENSTGVECPDPASDFVGLAVGNLDEDADLDVWAIGKDFQLTQLQSDL